MNQREAKRRACRVAADVLEKQLVVGLGLHLATTEEEAGRIELGVVELLGELRRRGDRAQKEDPAIPLPKEGSDA